MGRKPKAATPPVVNTARMVCVDPSRIASRSGQPPKIFVFTSLASTTPFSTETPAKAMNPTAAGMLNGRPRAASASSLSMP